MQRIIHFSIRVNALNLAVICFSADEYDRNTCAQKPHYWQRKTLAPLSEDRIQQPPGLCIHFRAMPQTVTAVIANAPQINPTSTTTFKLKARHLRRSSKHPTPLRTDQMSDQGGDIA